VARLQEDQRDVTLTEYPDSQHGFDAGLLGVSSNVVAAGAQTVRNCRIRESEGGVLVNAETNEPFSDKDACVETNPHVGGNPATAEEARKAVSEFLQALFQAGVSQPSLAGPRPPGHRDAAGDLPQALFRPGCRCERGNRHISVVSTEADSLPVREVLSWRSRVGQLLKAVEHAGRCRF
jgi:hypothetical protein